MVDAQGLSHRLPDALRELESHVARSGWDQPTRLFALVSTTELLRLEPQLAADSVEPDEGDITSIEQESLPPHEDLTDLLTGISWPYTVLGAAVVAERIMLPPNDNDLASDPQSARLIAASNSGQHELRVAAAALRNGDCLTLVRLRAHDDDESVIVGADLMPGLSELLFLSFQDS